MTATEIYSSLNWIRYYAKYPLHFTKYPLLRIVIVILDPILDKYTPDLDHLALWSPLEVPPSPPAAALPVQRKRRSPTDTLLILRQAPETRDMLGAPVNASPIRRPRGGEAGRPAARRGACRRRRRGHLRAGRSTSVLVFLQPLICFSFVLAIQVSIAIPPFRYCQLPLSSVTLINRIQKANL